MAAATETPVELRVYLPMPDLGQQFAAYLGTPTRARGYPPIEGDHALIVEVAPALAIERVIDLALKAVPEVEPGIHYVERQFGVLEVHASDENAVERAGRAILDGIGARAEDTLRPHVTYMGVIEDVTDQHAVIINRNREASMLLPGQSLLVVEVAPALFAAAAANAAERAAPSLTLVSVSMIGAAGRLYLAGESSDIVLARDEIGRVLGAVDRTRSPGEDMNSEQDRTAELAHAALQRFGVGADATVALCNVSENHTYRVEDPTTGSRFALRVHRPGYRSAQEIESELMWIDALREEGVVDTPSVVAATDGERVVSASALGLDPRNVVMFEWLDGAGPDLDDGPAATGQFEILGAISARMHEHVRRWARPSAFSRPRWDYDVHAGAARALGRVAGRARHGRRGAPPARAPRPDGRASGCARSAGQTVASDSSTPTSA